MERKEQWVNQTMDTGTYIKQVAPSQELRARLKCIPTTLSTNYSKLPKRVVWSVAASIAVLIYINCIALNAYNSNVSSDLDSIELIDPYFSYLTQIEL